LVAAAAAAAVSFADCLECPRQCLQNVQRQSLPDVQRPDEARAVTFAITQLLQLILMHLQQQQQYMSMVT
jgi:hypothetical protein